MSNVDSEFQGRFDCWIHTRCQPNLFLKNVWNTLIQSLTLYLCMISKKDPSLEEDVELDRAATFIDDLFTAAHHMYNTKQDVNHNESVFNYIFVYPFLCAVAAVTNEGMCDFGPGERLTVVLTILKPICHISRICRQAIWATMDECGPFLYASKQQVINCICGKGENPLRPYNDVFGILAGYQMWKGENPRLPYKGLFGTVAMLKTITDEFGKVKLVFVQAAADMLPELLQFFWNMKELINKSIQNTTNLRQNHINNRSASRYSKHSPPLIINLVQHDDSRPLAFLLPSPIINPVAQ
ncbi:unnamed protein product [Absidia cylindrospora]